MKKLFLFPFLLLAILLGACTANETEDMTIELACPKPVEKVSGNTVTITWSAIAKTAGYAYRFDQGEYVQLEADVLTLTAKMTAGTHTFEMYAVGNQTHTTHSAVRKIDFLIDLELVAPEVEIQTDGAEATFSWEAVPNAVGYAYKVDDKTETEVDDDVLTFTTKLTAGKHTFSLQALGDGVESTDSKPTVEEFEIDLSLPTPTITILIEGQGATLSWGAVVKATGYAYKVDNGAEVKVGASVLSYTKNDFTSGKHTFSLIAEGDGAESTDSTPAIFEFDIVDTSVGVFLKKASGAIVKVEATTQGIYAGTFDCTANDTFTVLVDDVEHGFLAFGGNGGVGTVNSRFAALPFYKGYSYTVRESLGRLTAEDDLNPLYVNTGAAVKVYVKIDRTNSDNIPRYYMKLETAADPSILLEQYFDLMIFGGDWTQPGKAGDGGTKIPTGAIDGTEAGAAKSASYTTVGANLGNVDAAYIANRGLAGWTVSRFVYEFPSYIRLSNSSKPTEYGILTTPALSTLTSATNVTVAFDGLRFASAGNITVKVIGAGIISSASVVKDGEGNSIRITPETDGKSFLITSAHGTKHANDAAKSFSNFTFTVQGAASDTQICWDASSAATSSDGRYCLDNIVIRKN